MQRVRSLADGQLGFLVEQDGKQWVRLDRGTHVGAETRLVPYVKDQWKDDKGPKLPPMGLARVCYDADRALRLARGEYGVPEWIAVHSKTPEAARAWMSGPPKAADPARHALYAAVRKALADE